jgi:hypothetical protein
LVPGENGFRDHGTDAARAQNPADRSEDMNEKHEEMAHRSIVARIANSRNYAENYQFASECVQLRLVCSAGVNPAGVEVRAP